MKKITVILLAIAMVLSIVACSSTPATVTPPAVTPSAPTASPAPAPAPTNVIVQKLGHVQTADHPYQAGAIKYKELVETASGGKLRVDLFPSSQLGGTREQMEGVQLNTMQYTVSSVAQPSTYNAKFKVFTLPYIFRDEAHAFKVTDGPIGQQLAKELESSKIKILGYWANGWRHITNGVRPIKTVADVKGLKLRSQEAPIFVSFVKSIGAVPSVIPFGELYTALEQKVVDGQENPFAQIANNKFYEVQKYMSLTYHTFDVASLLMSIGAYNALSPDLQQAVNKAGAEASTYQRKYAADVANTFLKEIKDNGMQVEENVDLDSFREKAYSVYGEIAGEIGQDLIDSVVNTK